MIVDCPSCSTRYAMPGMPSGAMKVTCRVCGHSWQEVETLEIKDSNAPALIKVIDHDSEPEIEARRLAEIAREAQDRFESERAARRRNLKRWSLFAAFLLVPVAAAAAFPERVVKLAPVTYRAYETLGYDINLYGLEIRKVERQHAIIDGTRVLSIRGDIGNISNDVKKIPWLRFALVGADGKELYTWTLDTASRPLPPGQLTTFTTRVAAPPEAAQNLQIRFAKADEIGSTASQ
ncbi:MAG: zinc-ribbon domain-containing protein [Proteobacteria bacterium]|nr:zinc-ribbon domain-containing protein [Pseudomonadota bacterium]